MIWKEIIKQGYCVNMQWKGGNIKGIETDFFSKNGIIYGIINEKEMNNEEFYEFAYKQIEKKTRITQEKRDLGEIKRNKIYKENNMYWIIK